MIAALYVQKGGVYFGLPDVDPWDEARDARLYAGPWPVVAHPPCQLWTNLAHVNFKRYGGEHNRPGNDGGCFAAALHSVRRWGGVLEHPAESRAWPAFRLRRPAFPGWREVEPAVTHAIDESSVSTRRQLRAWVCEVWQSAYGHKARKRTWLYYAGNTPPPELDWTRHPGTHQCGWFDRIKPTLSKREASATSLPFRDMLLALARHARG